MGFSYGAIWRGTSIHSNTGWQTHVTYLRSQPARVVCNARVKSIGVCLQMQLAAEVEVSDLHPPVLVHQQVGGLQISVQDGGLVAVKLQHALYNNTPSASR